MKRYLALSVAALAALAGRCAWAQVDFSGNWNTVRHEDQPDRGPGVGLGDYTGIPLTDAARQWAESWDASRLTMPEQQCRVHVAHYIYRGPLNLRIWQEKDPRTQELIAIKHYISTYEQTRTIWMDGRAHPPAWAPHTWMGFSTGHWEGDKLVVETTHIKQGWHRRNGVPASDWTTMTDEWVRHGDYLTQIEIIRDPVYLTEPMVKSQHFRVDTDEQPSRNWLWPCTAVIEIATRDVNEVPHYLPGQNPYLTSSRQEAHLPLDGAAGGAATIYPEWVYAKAKLSASHPRVIESAPVRPPDTADDEVHIWPIRDNVFMLVGAGANSTVQVGDDGVLVVDSKLAGSSPQVLAAIESLSSKPIRYVVDTSADLDHLGGNEAIAKAGKTRTGGVVVRQIGEGIIESAAILAHENVLTRVSAPTGKKAELPQDAWPTDTFFNDRRDFPFNGEGVVMRHEPAAHSDGDIVVYFRKSDVISTGDVFTTTGYPVIDVEHGGTVNGVIAALNDIIELAIPDVDHQGGTMIVPGHGRLSDEMDVVEYRDMITIVRDRIADMIAHGKSLEAVRAARPTYDYDARYGAETGAWTTTMFVDAVYETLKEAAR